jgi:Uma2 family endonuclease
MANESEAVILIPVMEASAPHSGAALLTAEEFWLRCGDDRNLELVGGRVVKHLPTAPTHGSLDSRLNLKLAGYVIERGLGEVYLNTGFVLARNPDVVRGPDQAFVSASRLAAKPPPPRGFWEIAPDLVVEIVSPEDTAEEIAEKVGDYLRSGVRLIWIIYPRRKQLHVFRPGRDPHILQGDDAIEGEDVVPGFRVPLVELWK